MYPHVGTCIPYFGFSYGGIGNALTMWPLMSNPLRNLMAPPKPILGVAQTEIVIDQEENLDEDDVFLERKHNLILQRIVPTRKPYHEQMG